MASLIRLLIDLTMNSFDDVRSLAASLLKCVELRPNLLLRTIDRGEKVMCRTGRADHADGYGRLMDVALSTCPKDSCQAPFSSPVLIRSQVSVGSLLSTLEADITTATIDLRCAVASAPIHGRLIALRYDSALAD